LTSADQASFADRFFMHERRASCTVELKACVNFPEDGNATYQGAPPLPVGYVTTVDIDLRRSFRHHPRGPTYARPTEKQNVCASLQSAQSRPEPKLSVGKGHANGAPSPIRENMPAGA
jgi:hypothetical protein